MIPERGLGIVLKIDDGAGRGAETVMAAILDKLGVLGNDSEARAILHAPIINTRGEIVGERRPSPLLARASIAKHVRRGLGRSGSILIRLFHVRR